ncbi:hypothetical protein FRC03_004797 [Tulasnella sp. 419]|nr:hypothetical protein FRC03_004797 [Tulasnella sp. 419]
MSLQHSVPEFTPMTIPMMQHSSLHIPPSFVAENSLSQRTTSLVPRPTLPEDALNSFLQLTHQPTSDSHSLTQKLTLSEKELQSLSQQLPTQQPVQLLHSNTSSKPDSSHPIAPSLRQDRITFLSHGRNSFNGSKSAYSTRDTMLQPTQVTVSAEVQHLLQHLQVSRNMKSSF